MDVEQMELLERLARLRELGAISRSEFRREKEAIFRAPPRALPVPLRALPAPGTAGPGAAPASAGALPATARARLARIEAEPTLVEHVGRIAGWVFWALFSLGGLDALLARDPLESLSLLVAGLFFAPPLHRLLALRLSLLARLAILVAGVIAALGIGSAPRAATARAAAAAGREASAACGEVVSRVVEDRRERARAGIARPWVELWEELRWARVAGRSALEEWRAGDGA
jgi:hypothetical protein